MHNIATIAVKTLICLLLQLIGLSDFYCCGLNMEKLREVNQSIGEENIKKVLEWIENRYISEDQLKRIAGLMDGKVHGVFVDKRVDYKRPLDDVFRFMLDKWYTTELHKPDVDGYARLVQILKEVDLGALVTEMNN